MLAFIFFVGYNIMQENYKIKTKLNHIYRIVKIKSDFIIIELN